jgi:hypothetical protein
MWIWIKFSGRGKNMDRRIALIGVFVLVLGIVFAGVSGISYEKEGGYWYQGDGTARRDYVSDAIFFEKGERWAVENISYLLWTGGTNQSISLPTDGLQISLYDNSGNLVTQVTYGDMKQMPTGLPVPDTGLHTIKIEQNIGESNTISATFVRWVYKSESISPYNYLFPAGIVLLLGGAGTAAYGAVKRSRASAR